MKSLKTFVNKLFKFEESDFVAVDLGARLVKGFLVKESEVEVVFIEESKRQNTKAAAKQLRKHGLHNKQVRVSLKGPDTLIRYIPFPKLDKSKLREAFTYELSKYIPFSQNDVYFDVYVLNENYSKNEFLVLLAAARKRFIDSVLEEFQNEKVGVGEVTLNNLALLNLYFHTEKDPGNTALVDVGFSSTLLNLIKKDTPYLTREIKLGGSTFLERVSNTKHVVMEEVEKWIQGNAKDREITQMGEELFVELSEEIRNSFDYFEMNAGDRINKVYLCGGFSHLKGIEKMMSSSLGGEVKVWDLGESFPYACAKNVACSGPLVNVGLGLSL